MQKVFLACCLHQSFPDDGSRKRPLLPCSNSYRMATLSLQTHCSNCPAYNVSVRTAEKTPFLCCSSQSQSYVTTRIYIPQEQGGPVISPDTGFLCCCIHCCLSSNRRGPRRKYHSFIAVCGPLPSNGRCVIVCFSVVSYQRVYKATIFIRKHKIRAFIILKCSAQFRFSSGMGI
jgi:hypothetical protein